MLLHLLTGSATWKRFRALNLSSSFDLDDGKQFTYLIRQIVRRLTDIYTTRFSVQFLIQFKFVDESYDQSSTICRCPVPVDIAMSHPGFSSGWPCSTIFSTACFNADLSLKVRKWLEVQAFFRELTKLITSATTAQQKTAVTIWRHNPERLPKYLKHLDYHILE